MRQLYLVRHAQAEGGLPDQKDFVRALTAKGRHDATALGAYLEQKNLTPEKILISPAKRTQETFALLAAGLEHKKDVELHKEIYNAGLETLQALISSTDHAIKSLMLVGHNPGMHTLAMYYAASSAKLVSFPPATLCVLDFDRGWSEMKRRTGQVTVFWTPDEI